MNDPLNQHGLSHKYIYLRNPTETLPLEPSLLFADFFDWVLKQQKTHPLTVGDHNGNCCLQIKTSFSNNTNISTHKKYVNITYLQS